MLQPERAKENSQALRRWVAVASGDKSRLGRKQMVAALISFVPGGTFSVCRYGPPDKSGGYFRSLCEYSHNGRPFRDFSGATAAEAMDQWVIFRRYVKIYVTIALAGWRGDTEFLPAKNEPRYLGCYESEGF